MSKIKLHTRETLGSQQIDAKIKQLESIMGTSVDAGYVGSGTEFVFQGDYENVLKLLLDCAWDSWAVDIINN
jgi:hypothetical protein